MHKICVLAHSNVLFYVLSQRVPSQSNKVCSTRTQSSANTYRGLAEAVELTSPRRHATRRHR